MTVNITQLQGTASIIDVVGFVNTNASGLFFALILLALFFILFMSLRKYGTVEGLIGASFPSFIISILLKSAGLINFGFVILFFLILAFSIFFKYMDER